MNRLPFAIAILIASASLQTAGQEIVITRNIPSPRGTVVDLYPAGQTADAKFTKDVKQYIMLGEKIRDIDAELTISETALTVTRKADDVTVIQFTAITGATYDRRQRQRKMLGLPMTGQGMAGAAQKVQHFLTVRYKTDQTAGFVELELGKDIANRVVSTLETKSGKPVEKTGS